ncbi:MAG: prenyltransferase [Chitinophagaceae bacterium]|nr:MAG: prenyltransferase [Chitinophagaceae bacterium]
MPTRPTIQLLRIPFSVFLSPIYFFALSETREINVIKAVLVFIILHLLIYPASNGYNSYMDRDTGPIGGLEKPPPPSKQLYQVTIVLDLLGIALGFLVSPLFGLLMPLYIGASKAYSYRGIRLKKYPVIGYLTVILVQGAFTFWLVWYGVSSNPPDAVPWKPMLACAFLIGGFYPLTQVYQHSQDKADGVITISYLLGYRGTFVFCAVMYAIAWSIMAQFFISTGERNKLWIFSILLIPVIAWFFLWLSKVWSDPRQASFRNTMRMTWIASISTNIAFIILLIQSYLD